jgi:hypothetical protein
MMTISRWVILVVPPKPFVASFTGISTGSGGKSFEDGSRFPISNPHDVSIV